MFPVMEENGEKQSLRDEVLFHSEDGQYVVFSCGVGGWLGRGAARQRQRKGRRKCNVQRPNKVVFY